MDIDLINGLNSTMDVHPCAIRVTVRTAWVSLLAAYPYAEVFERVLIQLPRILISVRQPNMAPGSFFGSRPQSKTVLAKTCCAGGAQVAGENRQNAPSFDPKWTANWHNQRH
ncbi:MAG TPA: hypothetical protein PKD64_15870, partial [Pirellulaceae bacterium]|nr:hypothetical protein [Pirellulaceae bacterium]